ncbi:MAG TPA: VOC family protein [Chloroflexi bacterium]|nr:VOC family protein [Chloroflexota bacterium]HPO59860.1 VOC family protein [Anaerolineaceae bacterium]
MQKYSQITFLYYEDLEPAARFYKDVLKLDLVQDQKMAKIYRVGAASYLGIVDGNKGFLKAQPKSAVLVTLVVDDVEAWHAYLVEQGVKILQPPKRGIHAESVFFEDPGGYALEIQRFLDPAVQEVFAR